MHHDYAVSFGITGRDFVLFASDTSAARSIVRMKGDEDKQSRKEGRHRPARLRREAIRHTWKIRGICSPGIRELTIAARIRTACSFLEPYLVPNFKKSGVKPYARKLTSHFSATCGRGMDRRTVYPVSFPPDQESSYQKAACWHRSTKTCSRFHTVLGGSEHPLTQKKNQQRRFGY